MEALETLGDRRIARALIPLLEERVGGALPAIDQTLEELSAAADPWIRALALRAQAQQLLGRLHRVYQLVRQDDEPLVRQAVSLQADGRPGPSSGEVAMPQTADTLGTFERILFLQQVPIFHDLPPEDLQQIAEIASERVFPSGESLCQEGELGDELFVIVEGRVRVAKRSNGAVRTLRYLESGEQIGELAILREEPRSATVVAEGGPVRTLVLAGDALRAILQDRPDVALAMLASLAQRLGTLQ
jgi:hypothetical protein